MLPDHMMWQNRVFHSFCTASRTVCRASIYTATLTQHLWCRIRGILRRLYEPQCPEALLYYLKIMCIAVSFSRVNMLYFPTHDLHSPALHPVEKIKTIEVTVRSCRGSFIMKSDTKGVEETALIVIFTLKKRGSVL